MKSFLKHLCVGFLCYASFIASAHASIVDLEVGGFSSQTMSITFNGNTSNQTAIMSGTVDGQAYQLYCVDLTRAISHNHTYGQSLLTNDGTLSHGAITINDNGTPLDEDDDFPEWNVTPYVVPNKEGIAWLLQQFSDAASASEDTRLGLQAAIWKVEYGDDFTLNPVGTSAAALAAYLEYYQNGYLLNGPNTADPSDVNWITPSASAGSAFGDLGQGLAAVPVQSHVVPEPSSLALMILGLMGSGLASVRTRRNRLRQ